MKHKIYVEIFRDNINDKKPRKKFSYEAETIPRIRECIYCKGKGYEVKTVVYDIDGQRIMVGAEVLPDNETIVG